MTPEHAEKRPATRDQHLVSFRDTSSFAAEQYRTLRHLVEQLHTTRKMIAVTSPVAGDGKTTTALNLAGALAQAPEARILVVDLDLRTPSVSKRLGLSEGAGLVDAILDTRLKFGDVVRSLPELGLAVLPAGQAIRLPYELLKSARLRDILQTGRQQYDYVVVDTPPVVPVPDCGIIADQIDGFLMVVAAHRTPRQLLEDALDRMDPEKLMGILFNGDEGRFAHYYGYYYGYGHGNRRRRR